MPLVEWSAVGGLCPWGLCSHKVTVYQDGSWHAANSTNTRDGALDAAVTQELRARIARDAVGFEHLPPSTGGCPSAYDGADLTFAFTSEGRATRVSNCTKELSGSEFLNWVQGLLAPIASAIPNPRPVPRDLLIEWQTSTPEVCPYSPSCAERVIIARDGWWRATNKRNGTEGYLDAATARELARRVDEGVASLATLAPSQGCPSWGDGADLTYRFFQGDAFTYVTNCEKVVPGGNALILYVDPILRRIADTIR